MLAERKTTSKSGRCAMAVRANHKWRSLNKRERNIKSFKANFVKDLTQCHLPYMLIVSLYVALIKMIKYLEPIMWTDQNYSLRYKMP